MTYPVPPLTIALTSSTVGDRPHADQRWQSAIVTLARENIVSILVAARNCGIRSLRFVGGEPLLAEPTLTAALREILQSLNSWDSVHIFTSAAIPISDVVWGLFEQVSPRLTLVVQVDSLDEGIYARLHSHNGLPTALQNIQAARARDIKVAVQTTVRSDNRHEIEAFIDHVVAQGCDLIFEDIGAATGTRGPEAQYVDLDELRQLIVDRYPVAGMAYPSGGFGVCYQSWRLSTNSILSLRDSGLAVRYAGGCAITECDCCDGGFPLLVTPDMQFRLCAEQIFRVDLRNDLEQKLRSLLIAFVAPWDKTESGPDAVGPGGAVATGATLARLSPLVNPHLGHRRLDGDSVDLELSEMYRTLKKKWLGSWRNRIDAWQLSYQDESQLDKLWPLRTMPPTGIWLEPNGILYGASVDRVTIPRGYVGLVTGRTTWARIGLSVTPDVAKLQSGRTGHVHFQITNNSGVPIRLLPHMYVAQLLLLKVTDPYELPGEQYMREGVYNPILGLGQARELEPCVLYANKLEHQGRGDMDALHGPAGPGAPVNVLGEAERHRLVRKPKPHVPWNKTKIGVAVGLIVGFIAAAFKGVTELIVAAGEGKVHFVLPWLIGGVSAVIVVVAVWYVLNQAKHE